MAQSEFSITRKILQILKIGDQGKIDSFLVRTINVLTKEREALIKNKQVIKFQYEHDLEALEDKRKDAEDELENSYQQIDIDKIKTNEDQRQFVEIYLDNIKSKKKAISDIEEQIKTLTEFYQKEVQQVDSEIVERQLLISKLKE